jgi:hypothetical protein
MDENDHRGQSEVIDSLLLVGLVVIAISTTGGFILINYSEQARDSDTLIQCNIVYEENTVTITHQGGDSADVARLRVILRNDSSESEHTFGVSGGDGDSRFEAGESATFGSVSTETDVLLVGSDRIICESTVP